MVFFGFVNKVTVAYLICSVSCVFLFFQLLQKTTTKICHSLILASSIQKRLRAVVPEQYVNLLH